MKEVICPVCGSEKVEKKNVVESRQLTLGPEFTFPQTIYTCENCEEQGDFEGINDEKFLEAQKHAQAMSIEMIIQELSEKENISMAHFERVFELPARTVTRWKKGDFSASSLALLRTIKTYPWITRVAENRFSPLFAKQTLLREGVNLFQEVVSAIEGTKVFLTAGEGASQTLVAQPWKYTQQKPKLQVVGE